MPRKLSKSPEEFFANHGWSASHFVPHAKFILENAPFLKIQVTFGRTVVEIRDVKAGGRKIKAYVHHNGRSNEHLTFTWDDGTEIETFHYTVKPSLIAAAILEFLNYPKAT